MDYINTGILFALFVIAIHVSRIVLREEEE